MTTAVAPAVTVVITTRNRKEDLHVCLESVARQTVAAEVIVVDDASTDGTAEMIEKEFPRVILLRHREMHGYIRGRNEAARIATAPVIVSIDDDAAFSTPAILADTLRCFGDERIGAVAIPYIDVHRGPQVRQAAPAPDGIYVVNTFIGTAHAVRRDLFLRLGGYREHLFHQGEESDFCIRMLAAGFVVRLGAGDPIHHFESPKRDFRRMDHYGPRNTLLFVYQNVPMPAAAARMPIAIINLLRWTLAPARLAIRVRGMAAAFGAMLSCPREPVPAAVHRLWRRLQRGHGALTLDDIAIPGRAR